MAAQLNSVRLKLEQRRKRIEDEKRKMENVMVKQREKVGQEAFLRAVVKGTVIRLTNLVLVWLIQIHSSGQKILKSPWQKKTREIK